VQDGQSDKTPLHYAIGKLDVDLVRLLLQLAATSGGVVKPQSSSNRCVSMAVAMLSARTGTGNAALHLAVSVQHMSPSEQKQLIQLLLSRGADPSARNTDGQLPREMTNNEEVLRSCSQLML